MSTPILICAGIAALFIMFTLACIATSLNRIDDSMNSIRFFMQCNREKPVTLINKELIESKPTEKKKDRTEATKRYNRTHRLVLDRKLGKHRWVKKSECHRELNLATGKEIWVANE